MDPRTLRVLEYDKALGLLAGQASTALGKEKCLRLRPRGDRGWIGARLAETSEARRLLTDPALGAPPWGGVTDQNDTLGRAGARALLTPGELLAVRDLAAACRRMKGYFERAGEVASRESRVAGGGGRVEGGTWKAERGKGGAKAGRASAEARRESGEGEGGRGRGEGEAEAGAGGRMEPVSRPTAARATHAAPPGEYRRDAGATEGSDAGGTEGESSVVRLGLRVEVYPEIEAAVERTLTEDGEIRPDATPELARLLRARVVLRERLRERMESLAQSFFARGYLQDPLVVERGGRMCVPVLATHQGRFEGIVHDRSGSGATLFMEPLAIVPQGNELRDTELAIDEEYRKILADLSALVGRYATALQADLRRLTALDVIFAKGRLALVQDAQCPEIADYVDLPDARHPLLGKKAVPIDFHLGEASPPAPSEGADALGRRGGEAITTLVVTGPNTGGKTVALKTVGLLGLLAQTGLHIPAGPTCKVPVFQHVFADIGDEQSLEQSLSTFSSHMSQIVKILHKVQAAARIGEGPVLVLLDEIGAGTDPTEGTALAQAILEALHGAFEGSVERGTWNVERGEGRGASAEARRESAEGRGLPPAPSLKGGGSEEGEALAASGGRRGPVSRQTTARATHAAPPAEQRRDAGATEEGGPGRPPGSPLVCLTVVTTHYNELKAFAYNTPGMQNARVDFDARTLEPTYRLLIGSPGSSNAFQVAQRLGLPKTVVSRARERVDQVGRDFARALEQLERTQQDLTARRREAESAGREVERLRAQHQRELEEFHAKRREAMQKGFTEAQEILRDAQERAAQIIRGLQTQEKHTADSERLRQELAEERRRLQEQEAALEQEMRHAEQVVAPPEAPRPLAAVAPGLRVRVADWEREATVIEAVGKDRALVAVGSFQVEVPLADLYPIEEKPGRTEVHVLAVRKKLGVPDEIMLIGKTVAEATADLDKYLDDAALAGREEVRIVHGKGTGALRKGVRAYLKGHRVVESFKPAADAEGGEGATVVRLKG